jgi:CRISPR/Cas system-associated exonuclease Cas4 (RecB family)
MDKVLKTHFDNFMSKGLLPPELMSEECIKGKCKLFSDSEKLKIWRNNLKGISYTDPSSGVVLRGAVDNILVKGLKLIVLDYKTRGYPLKEDTASHYQLQMNVYNYLLRKNGYKTEDFGYLLFYYPKEVLSTGEVVFDTNLVEMKVDVDSAEKVFKEAVECIKGEIPAASKECKFCEYAGKAK